LQGEFSRLIDALGEELIQLRLYVEAAIDFTDEDIDFLGEGDIQQKLAGVSDRLQQIQRTAKQGCVLRDGLTVVIAGRPNAGKSSLLNCLAGREAAIVTEIAGTTRDLLREHIQIDGMPLHIIDTAGLREGADMVEREGIRRAREAIAQADLLLLMIDDLRPETGEDLLVGVPGNLPVVRVFNKIDLSGNAPGVNETAAGWVVRLSVKTGAGMDALRQLLKQRAGYDSGSGEVFIARRRHLDALARAREAVERGLRQLQGAGAAELLAEDLRLAQLALSEITGAFTSDDLLGRIFGSFCIGK
jgi:tRNA modification GTPase